MIIVKNIETLHVNEGDKVTVTELESAYPPLEFPPPHSLERLPKVETEDIHGHTFYNRDGEKIVVGWSKEVQQVLGLPFEVFHEQQKTIKNSYQAWQSLWREKEGVEHRAFCNLQAWYRLVGMSLWKRIKFLFLGSRMFLPDN